MTSLSDSIRLRMLNRALTHESYYRLLDLSDAAAQLDLMDLTDGDAALLQLAIEQRTAIKAEAQRILGSIE